MGSASSHVLCNFIASNFLFCWGWALGAFRFPVAQDACAKNFLDGETGFLERASRAAAAAARHAAPRVREPQAPKHLKTEKPKPGSKFWWVRAGYQSNPLRTWYHADKKKGLKMDQKNFASRAYHRVDDAAEREAAQEAHADAKLFLASL